MSGEGIPDIHVDGTGLKITIVAGQWHGVIATGLLAVVPAARRRAGTIAR